MTLVSDLKILYLEVSPRDACGTRVVGQEETGCGGWSRPEEGEGSSCRLLLAIAQEQVDYIMALVSERLLPHILCCTQFCVQSRNFFPAAPLRLGGPSEMPPTVPADFFLAWGACRIQSRSGGPSISSNVEEHRKRKIKQRQAI